MAATQNNSYPPLIFNIFKPARMGSLDVVRHFKRELPGDYGKIGHFGTLDPFACGMLLIGVSGAARLNEFIHAELPKTYLAIGKLGIETDTGDWEGTIKQRDDSSYNRDVIGSFSKEFIQERIDRFHGDYWQTPPIYSATKFQGKALHIWAREGVEIKKEPVKRHIHHLEVVHFKFPYLSIRTRVSSGTYVRTLFQDIAAELGTIGSLIGLKRESLGHLNTDLSLKKTQWPKKSDEVSEVWSKGMKPEDVLLFPRIELPIEREKAFMNGLSTRLIEPTEATHAWMMGPDQTNWGLVEQRNGEWKTMINFRGRLATQNGL